MRYLKKLITKHINIAENEWDELTSRFKKVEVKKGTIISNAGDIFSDFYFIKRGLARSYFTDINGKDFTWQIYFRGKSKYGLNHFMDDSVSYYENDASMLHFEALEDCIFYVISLRDMDEFLKNADKKWEHVARVWLHDTYFSSTYKRVISLMSENVEERYKRLLDEYPNIFKKVKSYHIATFLGVAPQTLSKLRKNESR
ncbi:Crp/Fnr family transcriptional regulator [Halarcobacter mediterraneus]|uniref:Crp/Fnr family transcriptional regulator n=1 Tax=Halarcobacter mediterraneus TaxID=2023153 RepID=A0A4Q1AXL2_9BACT|nr:Crp/Fnr family transcriptional regulator [Halarcobacter mediterraneus]RXK13080.1 Crp/Fnr family transcriptional regulator [Halarcobacter mediterraneus]